MSGSEKHVKQRHVFAWRLTQRVFSWSEMMGKNCRGKQKKGALGQIKLDFIKRAALKWYPTSPDEEEDAWAKCITAIDKGFRNRYPAKNLKTSDVGKNNIMPIGMP